MSEVLQQIREAQSRTVIRVAEMGLTALLAAGCSSGNTAKHNSTSNNEAAAATVSVANTCGDIDFSKNYADTHFGAPTAIFPNLYAEKDGKKAVYDTDTTSKTLKTTVANDYRALAYVKAFVFDTRSAVTPADLAASNIVNNAQNLIAKYEKNPDSIKADVAEVCDGLAPSLISKNNKFRVARNLTSEADFERTNGKVVKTGIIPASTPGVLEVFQINPNFDDGADASRRDSLEELASSIGVTIDGKLIIKLTTGPLMFDISKNSNATPVNIKIGGNQTITVKPNTKTGQVQAGGSNSTSNGGVTGGTNGTSGKTGTSVGNTPEKNTGPAGGNTPGSGSNPEASPGGTDNTPGGGTGPRPTAGPGGTAPTPAPTHEATQPPATQPPATQPPATHPPTAQPSPSPTSGSKGAEPTPSCTPSEYKPC
ncbi:MAG: hypothetical protein QFB87_01990 [Patescibacteria group bacterium]|nr:hypothetical protein [Patescibacteria group bacterium]